MGESVGLRMAAFLKKDLNRQKNKVRDAQKVTYLLLDREGIVTHFNKKVQKWHEIDQKNDGLLNP